MVTALAFIFVFGLLTIFHEIGHFALAKLVGIRVEEFGVGFGPKIVSTRRGETHYSVRLLPLGGFVKMTGEDGEKSQDQASFQNKSVFSRFAVIAAGPVMNFLLAGILFGLIFFVVGVPEMEPLIGGIVEGSPAQGAGLEPGDRVTAIDGQRVETWEELVSSIQASGDREIELRVEREGQILSVAVSPQEDPETGNILIGVQRVIHRYRPLTAFQYGFIQTAAITGFIIVTIGEMLTGQIAPEVAGPVGIVHAVGEVARTGILNLLSLAAILSINLALFNLFPIPMLDGGQLLFLGVEAFRGKPLEPEQEGFLKFMGIMLLLLLLVAVTYRDITRLIM